MKELEDLTMWTIGHSNLPWEDFLALLENNRIECVADVRRFAGSRKYPHYSSEALAQSLPASGITYLPLSELGGRRKPLPDSPNTAWRNASFRAYADHMGSDEYAMGRRKLVETARSQRTAMLCSEAVWWRCHRGLIADDLKVAGAEVLHILSKSQTRPHPYTPAATVTDEGLHYHADS